MSELKRCPFCGGEDIRYSLKTMGRREGTYHVAMYCNKCNCYGARTIIKPLEETRWQIENNEKYKEIAIKAWNTRKPMQNIVERLETLREAMPVFMTDYENGVDGGYLDAIEIVKEEGGLHEQTGQENKDNSC